MTGMGTHYCYYDSTTTGKQNSASGVAYCTDSYANASAFNQWDFENILKILTLVEYPLLV